MLRQAVRRLQSGSLFLSGPRRVGKTSFLMALSERLKQSAGYRAIYFDAEGCLDALGFVEGLSAAVQAAPGLGEEIIVSDRIGAASLSSTRPEVEDEKERLHYTTSLLYDFVDELERDGKRWFLLIDEFDLLLHRLDGYAAEFLNILRGFRLRQTDRPFVTWLFATTFSRVHFHQAADIGAALNDLYPLHLGPLRAEDADTLLALLAESYDISLPGAAREAISKQLGFLSPFYLQLIFSFLLDIYDGRDEPVSEQHIRDVIEQLLSPHYRSYLDSIESDLQHFLGPQYGPVAVDMLAFCASAHDGCSAEDLLGVGMKSVGHQAYALELADILDF